MSNVRKWVTLCGGLSSQRWGRDLCRSCRRGRPSLSPLLQIVVKVKGIFLANPVVLLRAAAKLPHAQGYDGHSLTMLQLSLRCLMLLSCHMLVAVQCSQLAHPDLASLPIPVPPYKEDIIVHAWQAITILQARVWQDMQATGTDLGGGPRSACSSRGAAAQQHAKAADLAQHAAHRTRARQPPGAGRARGRVHAGRPMVRRRARMRARRHVCCRCTALMAPCLHVKQDDGHFCQGPRAQQPRCAHQVTLACMQIEAAVEAKLVRTSHTTGFESHKVACVPLRSC